MAHIDTSPRNNNGQELRHALRVLKALSCGLHFALCVLLFAAAINAQTTPADLADRTPEELMNIQVYSASKFVQNVSDAPAFVTVITADEIQRNGYRTLADILKSVPGFYISYDRNYTYVGVRGVLRAAADYNTRVLLMVNGHRINDNIYDMAFIGTDFPLDVDLIERVEISRGPSSSLYGTSAFYAVIDVITRRGRDLRGGEISADAASFGSFRERVTYGNVFGETDLLLSATHYDSSGHTLYFPEFDTPENNFGVTSHTDDDATRSFFASLSHREWTVRGAYNYRQKGIPTGAYGTVFGDPRSRSLDQRSYLEVSYDNSFRNWELLARFAFDQYDYNGFYVLPAAPPDNAPWVELDYGSGKWWTSELKLSRKLAMRQELNLGCEFRDNLQQDQQSIGFLDRRDSVIYAFYGEHQIGVRRWLVLNVGARYDHYDTFGGTTNPRFAIIIKPRPKTTLKLLYGTAMRAPNAFEVSYAGLDYSANPLLRPERGRTYEVVWEQGIRKNFQLITSAYRTSSSGLISQEVAGMDEMYFANAAGAISRGLELQLSGKLPRAWQTRAGFSVEKSTDAITGAILTNSPRTLAKLNLTGPLWKKNLFLGFDGQYTGARNTLRLNRLGGYPLANVTLTTKPIAKRMQASFSVYNLLDRRYADDAGDELIQDSILQDGRSFRMKLVYHLGGEK
ncbi:MAG: TonB-dependent receptor [Acidobacteria bacterium]|nr:TonB-dependent receptor [Acidobacteriota bacterium]